MTKSELFKATHVLTKDTVKAGDDYRATFGLCLAFLIAREKKKAALVAIGGSVWEKNGHSRVYFNDLMSLMPIVKMGANGTLSKRSAERMVTCASFWFDLNDNRYRGRFHTDEAFRIVCNSVIEKSGVTQN